MRFDKNMLRLYAVTDRSREGEMSLACQVREAILGGATCVQLREKELDEESFLEEAFEIKELCVRYEVPFIINDNVCIALKCKADGVHVGQGDMSVKEVRRLVGEDMIVGVSAHTLSEALKAEEDGADYLGVGAVFPTSTKRDADAVSRETLSDICKAVKIPVAAIGGISEDNIMKLSGTGVAGVAVVSALFGSGDPKAAAAGLLALSKNL